MRFISNNDGNTIASKKLQSEIDELTSQLGNTQLDLANETQTRETEDARLSQAIATEQSNRQNADGRLQNNIDTLGQSLQDYKDGIANVVNTRTVNTVGINASGTVNAAIVDTDEIRFGPDTTIKAYNNIYVPQGAWYVLATWPRYEIPEFEGHFTATSSDAFKITPDVIETSGAGTSHLGIYINGNNKQLCIKKDNSGGELKLTAKGNNVSVNDTHLSTVVDAAIVTNKYDVDGRVYFNNPADPDTFTVNNTLNTVNANITNADITNETVDNSEIDVLENSKRNTKKDFITLATHATNTRYYIKIPKFNGSYTCTLIKGTEQLFSFEAVMHGDYCEVNYSSIDINEAQIDTYLEAFYIDGSGNLWFKTFGDGKLYYSYDAEGELAALESYSNPPENPAITYNCAYHTRKVILSDGSSGIDIMGGSIDIDTSTESISTENLSVNNLATINNLNVTGSLNADNVLYKNNPTGTGSFSLNRLADSTIGTNSFAEGSNCTASGESSHAEGTSTKASGAYSHAEGHSTTADGTFSHAEGAYGTASGGYSHAEGNSLEASGVASHAEGSRTVASGNSSHAEGYETKASGSASHAEGYLTKAAGMHQHVQGRYNVEDTNNIYADIVGNGNYADGNRKNIEATTWTGDKRLKGDVYINCNDDSTGGTALGASIGNLSTLHTSTKSSLVNAINEISDNCGGKTLKEYEIPAGKMVKYADIQKAYFKDNKDAITGAIFDINGGILTVTNYNNMNDTLGIIDSTYAAHITGYPSSTAFAKFYVLAYDEPAQYNASLTKPALYNNGTYALGTVSFTSTTKRTSFWYGIEVLDDIFSDGNLSVMGLADISGDITAAGIKGTGNLSVTGNATIGGNATVKGNTTVKGNVTVNNDITISGNVNIDRHNYGLDNRTSNALRDISSTPQPAIITSLNCTRKNDGTLIFSGSMYNQARGAVSNLIYEFDASAIGLSSVDGYNFTPTSGYLVDPYSGYAAYTPYFLVTVSSEKGEPVNKFKLYIPGTFSAEHPEFSQIVIPCRKGLS